MKWTKASDRLPGNMKLTHWRDCVEGKPIDLSQAVNLLDCGCHDEVEWLDETESPSDSEAVDTESPVQYGTAFEADCEDGTWTFKMDEPFYVMAGRFKIIPLKK